jgi:hypothetical protein
MFNTNFLRIFIPIKNYGFFVHFLKEIIPEQIRKNGTGFSKTNAKRKENINKMKLKRIDGRAIN